MQSNKFILNKFLSLINLGEDKFSVNKFRRVAKQYSICLETKDYFRMTRMISNESKLRFNESTAKANAIIVSLMEISFKNMFFIEISDVYKVNDRCKVVTAFYWTITEDNIEIRKKDVGLFMINEKKNKIKLNFDGLIEVRPNLITSNNIDEFKIFVSFFIRYYNQTIFEIRTYNKSKVRMFFRTNADKAKVKIYSDNKYEEKELIAKQSIVEFDEKQTFKINSSVSYSKEISLVELSSVYKELEIGKFKIEPYIIYENKGCKLNKKEIDIEVLALKRALVKLESVKSLDDFYKIADRECIKDYYKEFCKISDIKFEELENKVFSIFKDTLGKYKNFTLETIEFGELFYKLRVYVDFQKNKGYIDFFVRKSNMKFIFQEEHLITLRDDKICTINIEEIEELKESNLKFAYYPEIDKLLISMDLSKKKFFYENKYYKVKILSGENEFVDYFEIKSALDFKNIFLLENVKSEMDIKNLLKLRGFGFISVDIPIKGIDSIIITDNSKFMQKKWRKFHL